MLIFAPCLVFAQRGISRSNGVSVSTTIVKKTIKAPNTYEAEVGFQQMAGLNLGVIYEEGPCLGLSYIGGYRFNDVLFAGGGIEFNTDFDDFVEAIYAHVRTYFTKRIWRPYVSLSLGGFWNTYYDYDDAWLDNVFSFYGDFSIGVDAHISEKFNVYMGFGINNVGIQLKAGLSF